MIIFDTIVMNFIVGVCDLRFILMGHVIKIMNNYLSLGRKKINSGPSIRACFIIMVSVKSG